MRPAKAKAPKIHGKPWEEAELQSRYPELTGDIAEFGATAAAWPWTATSVIIFSVVSAKAGPSDPERAKRGHDEAAASPARGCDIMQRGGVTQGGTKGVSRATPDIVPPSGLRSRAQRRGAGRRIHFTQDERRAAQDACAKAGGKFSQDAKSIGCGTNCQGGPGTDCTVYCPTDQKCTAQVIGARRPRSVAEALTKPESRRR